MLKPIKVLSVSFSDTYGGASRAAYRIHSAVKLLYVDSRMLVKHKETTDESVLELSQFRNSNFTNRVYSYIQTKIKDKKQQSQWEKYPNRENDFMSDLRSVSLEGAFQKIDYDILHLHWINLQFLDIKEILKVKKPIIWTLHDFWEFTGICHYPNGCDKFQQSCGNCPLLHSNEENDLSRKIWKEKQKIFSSSNFHIVTPSQWLADLVKKSSLLSHLPVTVIPNCLDTEVFRPIENKATLFEEGSRNNKKTILFGALNATEDRRKGFHKLIESIVILEKMGFGKDLEFLVFGAGNYNEDVQTNITITYLGSVLSG